jgi:hypothetical protein
MQSPTTPMRFVPCSGYVVLECRCGERLVLIGHEEDWHSEGRNAFDCECGKKLTFDTNRIEVTAGPSAMT